MKYEKRIDGFAFLGQIIKHYLKKREKEQENFNSIEKELDLAIKQATLQNGWFTKENILHSLGWWAFLLEKENLENWLKAYEQNSKKKNVLVIAAGNIPMVGFHDVISVLISGNRLLLKPSSDDNIIIPFLLDLLSEFDDNFKSNILIIHKIIDSKDYEAVIATGSNNSSRYFDYYFSERPHIIRKNRTSVAIVDKQTTDGELNLLAKDILLYFGLGCRNVSKIYLPKGFDLDRIFNGLYLFKDYINHNKFYNNYTYQKALSMMNKQAFTENGFMLLKETKDFNAPIAVLNYEFYHTLDDVKTDILSQKDNLQAIVGGTDFCNCSFGESQKPTLNTYQDGQDVIDFLNN